MQPHKVGDKLFAICCPGHSWVILDIDYDPYMIATYWGLCASPDCPKVCGCGSKDCMWDKISSVEHDSIGLINA